MSKATLQWVTPDAEYNMAYCARVSSIKNQGNKEYEKLFRYCIEHGHWSVYQMSSMCVHIETSLAVATQMLRHWSLSVCEPLDVQMLSQRYTDPLEQGLDFQPIELREAAEKNRQSSSKVIPNRPDSLPHQAVKNLLNVIEATRLVLKEADVADECIRMIYPQATTTRFFVSGSCRSWIHYFEQRLSEHAQMEHQVLALQIWEIFKENFPTVAAITLLKGGASVEAQLRMVDNVRQ